MLVLLVVLAGEWIVTDCENLQRVRHRAKALLRTYRIPDGINAFLPELHNMPTLDADEVIVVRHSAAELECGTLTVKSVFHQNVALGQQIQCRVNRRSGDPVTPAIHMNVELVGTKMSVELSNAVEGQEALLGASVLLSFEEIRKRGLQRVDVLRWSHGHKYICA